jgi:Cd2+/Zn2+-exporting ATPase
VKNPQDIPPEKDLCRQVLEETQELSSDIESLGVASEATGALKIGYDPSKTSPEKLHRSLHALEPSMKERLKRCAFRLHGRGCETCARKIENRLSNADGIVYARASFIGSSLCITYDQSALSEGDATHTVTAAGANAVPVKEAYEAEHREEQKRKGTLKERFQYWLSGERLEAVFALLALIFLLTGWIGDRFIGQSWVAGVAYLLAYGFGGYFGLTSALGSLKERTLDIDLLMILAALGAAAIGAPFEGAMLLFLFSLSNVMQSFAIGRTRKAIEALSKIRPQSARVLGKNDQAVETPIGNVVPGDLILIRPGERVPLDAEVLRGSSSVDQSSITGESIPVDKAEGDELFSGTINQKGSLVARVTKSDSDSTLSQLIELVEEAQSEKAKTQRFLEDAEQGYALFVILFTGVIMLALPLVFGMSWGDGFYRAITVMVVASPCALVISIPASVLSAIGNGARRGILFKGGAQLERAATIDAIAFDKTGTLTQGNPKVVSIDWFVENDEAYLASIISIESHSEHPLARAIVEYGVAKEVQVFPPDKFESETGIGVLGESLNKRLRIGKSDIVKAELPNDTHAKAQLEAIQESGQTAVVVLEYLEDGPNLIAIIRIADQVRETAKTVVQELKNLGIHHLMMLTGDSEPVAKSIAAQVGIDKTYANLLPAEKVELMQRLSKGRSVAMVGDGVNDAPALARSSVGIAMGAAGSHIAMESADIVLLSNDLNNVAHVIKLSRRTRQIILQNLAFAGGIIVLMVIATLLLPIWNIEVPLPLGVVAHEGGTVLVCLNGLRLLLTK